MQYTYMGFQQDELLERKFDHTSATILRYVVDFYSTRKMYHKVIDNRIWFWFKYDSVIEELPILGIKSASRVAQIVREWIDKKLCMKMIVKGHDSYIYNGRAFTRKGTYTYLSFDSEQLAILVGGAGKKFPTPQWGLGENSQPGCEEIPSPAGKILPAKDSSTTEPLTKNKSTTGANSKGSPIRTTNDGWAFYSDRSFLDTKTGNWFQIGVKPHVEIPEHVYAVADEIYGKP